VDKVIDSLNNQNIDLKLFSHLNSSNTQEKTEIINSSLKKVIEKAGELQGSINKQKQHIEKLVKEHKIEINGFLKNAGFKYSVDMIEDEKGQLKLQLTHSDLQEVVSDVKTHLSFGEKNAFSLVLFMYDAIKSNPDLIILDDPISSFDKNKKYAIIDMLFRKGKYFDDKTVLLLTHDFEPIVDMVLHHSDKFSKPFATFLENDNGILKENEINKADIKTFIDINKENTSLDIPTINKLVYIRRLMEITKQKTMGYQLISNLLHKRVTPDLTDNGNKRNMTDIEIADGVAEVKKLIPNFDYSNVLSIVKSDAKLKEIYTNTDNNYEKLHIYRIIYDDKPDSIESDIIQKFINQAFHIENDYIYQLNPRCYQIVPKYIILECDKYVEQIN
jgi:ABC-type lipoprotein export system ATPase subunit